MQYDVPKYVSLEHRVVAAHWDDVAGVWRLKVEDCSGGKKEGEGVTMDDYAHVIINATGSLNNWKWPESPGLESFEGHLV